MKIIHAADIHLGSKMEAKLDRDKAIKRKGEVRAAFNKMLNYAINSGVKIIMLSGDVFDSERPFKHDKEFFYEAIKNTPDIDFLYLRGNHDTAEAYCEELVNLKLFSGEWQSYEYENVVIHGIELSEKNIKSYYSGLKTVKDKINIVMLHGQTVDGNGEGVNIPKLKNLGIDYLALGHLHSYSNSALGEKGVYVYSGCLEGRGFDEIGEKGFVELDIDDKIDYCFIKNSVRTVRECTVDISKSKSTYEAFKLVKSEVIRDSECLLRVNLVGRIDFDGEYLTHDITEYLKNDYFFVYVKDKTEREFSMEKLEGDVSLSGEFTREVLRNAEFTEDEKQKIISVGLKALSGSEVE